MRRTSSVVEHSLGKGEVPGSLPGCGSLNLRDVMPSMRQSELDIELGFATKAQGFSQLIEYCCGSQRHGFLDLPRA